MRTSIRTVTTVALVGTLAMFAGCSSNSGSSPGTTAPSSGGSASESTSGAAESASDAGGPVTLDFWTTVNVAAQQKAVQSQANACAKKLGNVSIKYTSVTESNKYPKLLTAYQSGNPPDIMNTVDPDVAFGHAANQLVPVDDVINKLGKDDFIGSLLEMVSKDGHIWAIPDWALHQEVWYRKDLFKAKGLSIPTSWAELISDAKALDEGAGGTRGMAMPLGRNQVAAQMFYSFFYADGGTTFDPKTGDYAFDKYSDKAIDAINTMVKLYKEVSPPASLNWEWGDFRTAFAKGEVAMTLDYGSVVGQISQQNPGLLDKIAAFPLPAKDGETKGVLGGGYYYMLGKTTPAREKAAKEVIECMYSADNVAQRALSRPVYAIPATHSAAKTSTYLQNPVIKQFKTTLDTIEKSELPHDYRYGMEAGLNRLAAQIESTTFFGDDIQAVALGKMTAKEAVSDINSQLQKEIALSGAGG